MRWLAIAALLVSCSKKSQPQAAAPPDDAAPVAKAPTAPPQAPTEPAAPAPDAAEPAEVAKPDGTHERIEALKEEAAAELMTVLRGKGDEGRYRKGIDIDHGAGLNEAIDAVKMPQGVTGREVSGADARERLGAVDPDKPSAPTPRSRVGLDAVTLTTDALDANRVLRRIRSRYLRGVKTCHEQLLKTKPTAAGTVAFKVAVSMTGKVTSASARGFEKSLDACLASRARKWRFGAPRDADGNPTTETLTFQIRFKPGD